jgi:hypothetical protein
MRTFALAAIAGLAAADLDMVLVNLEGVMGTYYELEKSLMNNKLVSSDVQFPEVEEETALAQVEVDDISTGIMDTYKQTIQNAWHENVSVLQDVLMDSHLWEEDYAGAWDDWTEEHATEVIEEVVTVVEEIVNDVVIPEEVVEEVVHLVIEDAEPVGGHTVIPAEPVVIEPLVIEPVIVQDSYDHVTGPDMTPIDSMVPFQFARKKDGHLEKMGSAGELKYEYFVADEDDGHIRRMDITWDSPFQGMRCIDAYNAKSSNPPAQVANVSSEDIDLYMYMYYETGQPVEMTINVWAVPQTLYEDYVATTGAVNPSVRDIDGHTRS